MLEGRRIVFHQKGASYGVIYPNMDFHLSELDIYIL